MWLNEFNQFRIDFISTLRTHIVVFLLVNHGNKKNQQSTHYHYQKTALTNEERDPADLAVKTPVETSNFGERLRITYVEQMLWLLLFVV